MESDVFIGRSYIQFDIRFVGNNIFRFPGMEFSDSDNGLSLGRYFSGNDGLQSHNGCGCHNNGVDRILRHSAVTAGTEECHFQAVAGCQNLSCSVAYRSCFIRHHMLSENHIRFRNFIHQAVIKHSLRTFRRFFSRLEYSNNRAFPVFFLFQ